MDKNEYIKQFNVKLQGTFYIPELFDFLETVPMEELKVQFLQHYMRINEPHRLTLRAVFECLWHPHVNFDLPVGKPTADMNSFTVYGRAPSNMFKIRQYLPYLVKGKMTIKNDVKRQNLFVQLVESMHVDEQELLVMMKDKSFDSIRWPTLTKSLVQKAIPGIFPEEKEVAADPSRKSDSSEDGGAAPQQPVKKGPGRPRKRK